jgi:hypothetical protein
MTRVGGASNALAVVGSPDSVLLRYKRNLNPADLQ